MNKINITFFEEYKKLDRLCGDIYQDQHGISHYIDDMKTKSHADSCDIPDWKTDLNQLIRIRHIRNQMAHAEGAFEEELCTQYDIDWIKSFYQRILAQADPCAMLYQNTVIKKETQHKNQDDSDFTTLYPNHSLKQEKPKTKKHSPKKKKNKTVSNLIFVFATILLIIIVMIIIGCMIILLKSS